MSLIAINVAANDVKLDQIIRKLNALTSKVEIMSVSQEVATLQAQVAAGQTPVISQALLGRLLPVLQPAKQPLTPLQHSWPILFQTQSFKG
jgi:hypothetical protein